MASFQEELERRAGGSLLELNATNEQVKAWNEGVTRGHTRAFDDRVLLGLGIDEKAPPHGDIRAYQVEVGALLHRTDRWVRETVQVAVAIRTASELGVDLPVELRAVPWRLVPTAVENVQAGRPLDYRRPKEPRPHTLKQVQKLADQLVAALEGMDDAEAQRTGLRYAADALEELAGQLAPGTTRTVVA